MISISSKYDVYWQKKLDEIRQLLGEAYKNGRSNKLDISDIQRYGERGSWYGVIEVFKDGLRKGEMVHVKSLGNVILENKLLDSYGKSEFRLIISRDMKVRAEQLDVREKPIFIQTKPVERKPVITIKTEKAIYLRIHELIESLPLHKYPISKEILPENGIYFFYENGEIIRVGNQVKDRIVRVGINKGQSRFPTRIFDHFGGNKNSSVFRKHLGGAIIRKRKPNDPRLKQWLKPNAPTFKDVEGEVSNELRQHFSFRCIKADDKNERLELEELLISTLANCLTYPSSSNWLGHFAYSKKIRISGLWNEQHIHSKKRIQTQHISRLNELINWNEWDRGEQKNKTQRNALILIPCCKQKNVVPSQGKSQPLPNIQPVRNQLLQFIQQTPILANKAKNQRGILNPIAPTTQAIDLYVGNFYQVAGNSLRNVLAGNYPSIHVLIVSAFYGLTKLNERLKKYELQMGDILYNSMKVYKFWQKQNLSQILHEYINQNNITHVWSLLPDSDPKFQYHRVFNDLWRILRNTQIQCFHVKVPGVGTGTGYKRAEWLVRILNTNPNYLIGVPFPPKQIKNISGYEFRYEPC